MVKYTYEIQSTDKLAYLYLVPAFLCFVFMETPLATEQSKTPEKLYDMTVKQAALTLGKYDKFVVRLIKRGKLPYQEITNQRNLKEYRVSSEDIKNLKGQLVGQDDSPTLASTVATAEIKQPTEARVSPTKKKEKSDKKEVSLTKYLRGKIAELEKQQKDSLSDNPLVVRLKEEVEELKQRLKTREDKETEASAQIQSLSGQIGYFKGRADQLQEEVLFLRSGDEEKESQQSGEIINENVKETTSQTEVGQSRTTFWNKLFGKKPLRQTTE